MRRMKYPRLSRLSQDLVRQMFDYDPESGRFTWAVSTRKGSTAGTFSAKKDGSFSYVVTLCGETHPVRRIIGLWMYGVLTFEPIKLKDGSILNHKLSNLVFPPEVYSEPSPATNCL